MGQEAKVEAALVAAVKKADGMTRKLNGEGNRHWPDRLVILPDHIFMVECKAPGKKPTKGQAHLHALLGACGVNVYVVDSVEDARYLIQEKTRERLH